MAKVRRTFNVPDVPEGGKWYAYCDYTGETLECSDFVTLLQSIAKQPTEDWELGYIPPKPSVEEEIKTARKRHEEIMEKFPPEVRKLLP